MHRHFASRIYRANTFEKLLMIPLSFSSVARPANSRRKAECVNRIKQVYCTIICNLHERRLGRQPSIDIQRLNLTYSSDVMLASGKTLGRCECKFQRFRWLCANALKTKIWPRQSWRHHHQPYVFLWCEASRGVKLSTPWITKQVRSVQHV